MSGLKTLSSFPYKSTKSHQSLPRISSSKALSSKPGELEVAKMNLMAIRKTDGCATEIVSTVPKVVIYKYDGANNTWERTSVEGTLFIYSRKAGPSHAFVVLNKLNSGNAQEMVSPGMEFRVQKPFILFKKRSGDIFGLCIQEEKVCQETGQLLTRLASGNVYSSQGASSSIAAGMRSKSTPQFRSDEIVKLDVNELLESSCRNYLGQTFSDDTNSQDSQNSDPITFSTTDHKTKPAKTSTQGQVQPKASSSSPLKSKAKGVTSKNQNSRGKSTSTKPVSTSQRKSVGLVEVASHSPTFGKRSAQSKDSRHKKEHLQHTASFDSNSSTKGGSKQNSGSLPGSRSSSPLETGNSPQKKTTVSSNIVSDSPLRVSSIQPGSSALSDHSNNIVRKLFSSSEPTSEQTQNSLKGLFSQASIEQASIGSGLPALSASSTSNTLSSGSPLPLQAISLHEIEKQMKDEAPSPDTVNPFTLFSSSSAGEERSNDGSLNLSSNPGAEKQQVLLQPSVFSTASASHATSTYGYTTVASIPQSTGNQLHFITGAVSPAQNQQDVESRSVSISVEPPSPLILLQQQQQELSASVPNSTVLSLHAQHNLPQQHSLLATSFPPIPPLIHSPGMRAAPLASSTTQEGTVATTTTHTNTPPPTVVGHQYSPVKNPDSSSAVRPGRTYSEPTGRQDSAGKVPLSVSATPPHRHHTYAGSTSNNPSLSPLSKIVIPQGPAAPSTAALMSPMQFSKQQQQRSEEGEGSGRAVIEELTREQMQQGLVYLIQHDAGFMDTLHKAYQLSVAEQQ